MSKCGIFSLKPARYHCCESEIPLELFKIRHRVYYVYFEIFSKRLDFNCRINRGNPNPRAKSAIYQLDMFVII